ncbi:MAG TPA: hypothetical protein VM265_08060 [Sphingomicrobium sp.]|nr:hypothetical protein [Sphingomicrobium sp.]
MLSPETPFPQVGSYALYHDDALPIDNRSSELVRILERAGDSVLIAFPLRQGAAGNKRVALAELIDGTPLDRDAARELHDLDRQLAGRVDGAVGVDGRRIRLTPRQKELGKRRDALKARMIWAPILATRLTELAARQRSEARRRAA